jgi:hypothetical protein
MLAKSYRNKDGKEQKGFNDLFLLENESLPCEHTMDSLDFIDWEYNGGQVVCLYRCSCGKKVTEIFNHSQTKISD